MRIRLEGLLAVAMLGVALAPHPARAASAPVTPMWRLACPAAAGMMVAIDPETGQLGMPTPEQRERWLEKSGTRLRVQSGRPAPVYHPNGMVSLDVRSWMREFTVVRIGAEGKARLSCFDDQKSARHAVRTPAAIPPATEDR